MRVVHSQNSDRIEGQGEPQFMLTDRKGGYLWLNAQQNPSKYCGGFFAVHKHFGWDIFKAVESIRFDMDFDELTNLFSRVRLSKRSAKATFIMGWKGFMLKLNSYTGKIGLVLDCRRIHDHDENGRTYEISQKDRLTLITYTKFKQDQKPNYSIYVAVYGHESIKAGDWEQVHYPYDKVRGDSPFDVYVYHALDFEVNGKAELAICYGTDKNDVIRRAKKLYKDYPNLVKKDNGPETDTGLKDKKLAIAYLAAKRQLNSLTQDIGRNKGIFAGLPWFFQFWNRDEAICTKALIEEGQLDEARTFLLRQLNSVRDDGFMANMYHSTELATADCLGWTCDRLLSYLQAREHVEIEECQYFLDRTMKAAFSLLRHHCKDGLIENSAIETWMDTSSGDDSRQGCRIEIQALFLSLLRLINFLLDKLDSPDKKDWASEEKKFAKLVKSRFYQDGILKDGVDDPTVRPNVFIAYYLYPKLLEKAEWEKVFDSCISRLWCGHGFSTIDKDHLLFQPN
ncbi:MAG: hypothetical protein KJ709_05870, partial [Nanoarchaeota archaeon]|nr:hypothetical protein [Nanoarchaeota archaeon]